MILIYKYFSSPWTGELFPASFWSSQWYYLEDYIEARRTLDELKAHGNPILDFFRHLQAAAKYNPSSLLLLPVSQWNIKTFNNINFFFLIFFHILSIYKQERTFKISLHLYAYTLFSFSTPPHRYLKKIFFFVYYRPYAYEIIMPVACIYNIFYI